MEKARYLIEYELGIEEKLKSFTKPVKEMIRKFIEKKLAVNPTAFGKPLKYSLKGFRRLCVGDYRIVFKILEDKVLVLIIDIDHRKLIYDE